MTGRRHGFVLLEVLIALAILAVAVTALLRGFVISLHAIRTNYTTVQATMLAESILGDFELEPPDAGRYEGAFKDDVRYGEEFKAYTWNAEVLEKDVKYRKPPRGAKLQQDLEPLLEVKLQINYDDGVNRAYVPIRVTTYVLEPTIFSDSTLQSEQLF